MVIFQLAMLNYQRVWCMDVDGRYIYTVNGGYKPTNITAGCSEVLYSFHCFFFQATIPIVKCSSPSISHSCAVNITLNFTKVPIIPFFKGHSWYGMGYSWDHDIYIYHIYIYHIIYHTNSCFFHPPLFQVPWKKHTRRRTRRGLLSCRPATGFAFTE